MFRHVHRLLASWEGSTPFREMLGVVLRKAEDHFLSHPRWPVLYLPSAIGEAFHLSPIDIERLAIADLLFFCYADITDDAEDQDLSDSWVGWGCPQAVNTGNALLFGCLNHLAQSFSSGISLSLVNLFTQTGLKMTAGQQLDLSNSLPDPLSMEDYLFAAKGKSGASIAAFACAPAIVAQASPSLVQGLLEYGENLGLVIQLISDVREAWSPSIGPDLMNGRLSLPILHALELSSSDEQQALLSLIETIRVTKEGHLLRERLDRLGVRMYVETKIELFRRKARLALEPLSPYPELRSVLDSLLDIPTFLASAPLI